MTVIAAADGSALGNPGAAGWAWFIDETQWRAGGWKHATNNQAELMAVLSLLTETVGLNEPLHILCDSQYVINSLTKWMPGWKRKGWKKSDGKPVLNRDLFEQLDALLSGRRVTFEWVKGHAGHTLNERVDDLARDAATAFQRGTPPNEGPGFTLSRWLPDTASQAEHPTDEPQPTASLREHAPTLFDFDEPSPPTPSVEATASFLVQALCTDPHHSDIRVHPESTLITVSGTVIQGITPITRELTRVSQPSAAITPVGVHRLGSAGVQHIAEVERDGTTIILATLWITAGESWSLLTAQFTERGADITQ